MCFKKYKIENVQISPEMKRDTCSAMVRNNQRLKVGCFSGSVLCLYLSRSSPAPGSTITQPHSLIAIIILILRMREMMSRVVNTLPRSHELGVDAAKFQSGPLLTPGGERCLLGDRALLETVKSWEGHGGGPGGASFIHFSGSHGHLAIGPRYYTGTFSSWEYQKYWSVAFLADKTEL